MLQQIGARLTAQSVWQIWHPFQWQAMSANASRTGEIDVLAAGGELRLEWGSLPL